MKYNTSKATKKEKLVFWKLDSTTETKWVGLIYVIVFEAFSPMKRTKNWSPYKKPGIREMTSIHCTWKKTIVQEKLTLKILPILLLKNFKTPKGKKLRLFMAKKKTVIELTWGKMAD